MPYGALHYLFWSFEYITAGFFAEPLTANLSDVKSISKDLW